MSEAWRGVVVELVRVSTTMDRPRAPGFNPNPPGQPFEGRATQAVLNLLQDRPGVALQRWQIVERTGRTHKAVGWALAYLRELKLIEALPDCRNPRYLRYRAPQRAHGNKQGRAA